MSETVTHYSTEQLEHWAKILRDSGRYAVLEKHRLLKLTVTKSVDRGLLENFRDYEEVDQFQNYILGSAGAELGYEMVHQGATVRTERRAEDYRHEYTFSVHVVRPK